MAEIVRAQQGDTVDLMAWRYYGRTDGTTEAVIEANVGLAGLGPVLPIGTRVTMPDVDPPAPEQSLVRLWD